MAPKDRALSITARLQYERFIVGTSHSNGGGFMSAVSRKARDIDAYINQMNGRRQPTYESRKEAIVENVHTYLTAGEWATLIKFTDYQGSRYHKGKATDLLVEYVKALDLDNMNEQFNNRDTQTHERLQETDTLCHEVLNAVRDATTVSEAENALTRLREWHVSLKAEAETLKELIANS
jgi:hypothetical protein